MSTAPQTLDVLCERLERHVQRATYTAVADLLGLNPQSMFIGYPFTPRYSWVVAKDNEIPTKFHVTQMHPDLFSNPTVISTAVELQEWLESHS
jgi:hypothetical protein